MKEGIISTKIVELFRKILQYKNKKILNYIYLALATFIAYSSSIFFVFVTPSLDFKDIRLSLFLFVVFTPTLFYLFKTILKNKINYDNNLSAYFLLATFLIIGLILTFLISSYYISLWFKTSVFDTQEYLKNYDLKARDTIIKLLPITLALSLLAFIIHKFYLLKSKGLKNIKVIISGLIEVSKLIFIISIVYAVTLGLSMFIFIIANLGYPG